MEQFPDPGSVKSENKNKQFPQPMDANNILKDSTAAFLNRCFLLERQVLLLFGIPEGAREWQAKGFVLDLEGRTLG